MTPDRLRQMADAADADLIGGWFPAGENVVSLGGDPHANLIAALGPDAARLLADAMDEVAWLASYDEEDCGEEACPDCRPARKRRDLLARFSALGEDTP